MFKHLDTKVIVVAVTAFLIIDREALAGGLRPN
jgi:hypothetical protein